MRLGAVTRLESGRAVVLSLAGLVILSASLRVPLVQLAHAPTVFNDELGYTKLAQSIGLDGRLALLDREGFSYSPLYPLLVSPIYALGASAPAAYAAIKVVNAVVISLALVPLYKIARFVLPRPHSLLVAALAVFAPLMSYPAFTMSENLAYPLCLLAVWAMLTALRAPSARADALVLAAIVVATLARTQLVVLLPVALTAVLLVGAWEREPRMLRRLVAVVRSHWLLFGSTTAALLAAGIRALLGGEVLSVFGRYANVGRSGLPSPAKVVELSVHHLAGLDLAVGVVPFVAALVGAFVFVRARFPRRYALFAAVAVSLTFWLVLQVAVDAALFDDPGGDRPRIHERFLIYAVPLFLVALVALVRARPAQASTRAYLAAGLVATVLPALIPFGTYVNATIGVDTFALLPFSHTKGGEVEPTGYALAAAVWIAGVLSLVYARMLRNSVRGVALLVAVVFAYTSAFVWANLDSASRTARSVLPAQPDWVDRVKPAGDVVLVADDADVTALETLYNNLSITRIYTLCRVTAGSEFGERRLSIGEDGLMRAVGSGAPVEASAAVVPARLKALGRVIARNVEGHQELLVPTGGRLSVPRDVREPGCPRGG